MSGCCTTDPGYGGTDPRDGGTDPGTSDTYTTAADGFEDVIDQVSGGDEIIVTGSGELAISEKNFSSPVLIRAASIGGTTLINATIKNSNNVTLHGFKFGPNGESTLQLGGSSLTNSEVLQLSSSPSVTAPTPLTAGDVGPSADL